MRKGFQRKELQEFVAKIRNDGLLAAMEYSDWDEFDGTDLGEAVSGLISSLALFRERLDDACFEKNVDTPWDEGPGAA